MRSQLLSATCLAFSVVAYAPLAAAGASTGLWPKIDVPSTKPDLAAPNEDAAIVVGIDRYDQLPRVVGAAENARDWEKYLLFGRGLSPERVTTLTDGDATVDAIVKAIKTTRSRLGAGGTLYFIFVGHGAPASDAKGVLLGADTRPSDASFLARSLAYDDLLKLLNDGSPTKSVVLLDACFSGISPEGKTLLPSVQPVVSTKLVAPQKTTVITAGTAAEYAGSLPGSERPALSYLVLGGLRGWADHDGDSAVTWKEATEYAGLVLRSLPNNHEQHPQIVSDTPDEIQQRSATEKAPDLAKLRTEVPAWKAPSLGGATIEFALKCFEDRILTTTDGLVIDVDDTVQSVTRARTGDQLTALVIPVSPGNHRVSVSKSGCEPRVFQISAVAGENVRIAGGLKAIHSALDAPPLAWPDHYFMTLEASEEVRILGSFRGTLETSSVSPPTNFIYENRGVHDAIPRLRLGGGLIFPFAEIGISAEFGTRKYPLHVYKNEPFIASERSYFGVAARATVSSRIPLGPVALRPLYVGAQLREDRYDIVLEQEYARRGAYLAPGWLAGAGVDVSLSCDFAARSFAEFAGQDVSVPGAGARDSRVFLSFGAGLMFAPSTQCRRERRIERTPARRIERTPARVEPAR